MSLHLTIDPSPRALALLRELDRMPDQLRQAIRVVLDRQNELTVGHIQRRKLSQRGPSTLGVRTNRLRASIRRSRARSVGEVIVSGIGTNVEYAGAHEFGFRGSVGVRAHQRRQAATVFGQPNPRAGDRVGVRAHQRQMVIPRRAPIATGINERAGKYKAALDAAILEVLDA